MSSFLENATAAQNPVNFAYGSAIDGATVVHAPPPVMQAPEPVYQAESVVAPAMTAAEVVGQLEGSNGSAGKRGRGRPRKYAPATSVVAESGGVSQEGGGGSGKRGRGRPVGSRGKQRSVLPLNVTPTVSGLAGVGFTPYTIIVPPGSDVLARLVSFSQVCSQAVCVLSASGMIASVTLQQPSSGGTVSYEGRFDILSISGSFLLLESGGHRSRTGGLSVSLAGPDGTVLGGSVAGLLTAASPVEVIVGTFMAASQQATKPGYNDTNTPKHVSSVGGSPPSRATMSGSSGGPVSPFNNSTGGCNNSNHQSIPNVAWS